jgi:heme/copper-type cytochrome/quinol oxidase subunit 2
LRLLLLSINMKSDVTGKYYIHNYHYCGKSYIFGSLLSSGDN